MYARVQNTEKIMYGKVCCEIKPLKCNIADGDELTIVVRLGGEDRNLITDIVKQVHGIDMFAGDHIELNSKVLDESEMKQLATDLGFPNYMELAVYIWDQWGLPFQGKLVRW